jgi:HSP20 family protein
MSAQTLAKKTEELAPEAELKRVVQPAVDLYEFEDSIVLLADLPGVDVSDLEVTVEKTTLLIRGPVRARFYDGLRQVYRERPVTEFKRSFRLSEDIDRDSVEAELSKGVLKLRLGKSAPALKKIIPIRST